LALHTKTCGHNKVLGAGKPLYGGQSVDERVGGWVDKRMIENLVVHKANTGLLGAYYYQANSGVLNEPRTPSFYLKVRK
jgi:hypothetical protein